MKHQLQVLFRKLFILKKNTKTILISSIVILVTLAALFGVKKYRSFYHYESMSIFDYIQRPDDELNISIAALILSKEYDPHIKFDMYNKFIDEIAGKVQCFVGESDLTPFFDQM